MFTPKVIRQSSWYKEFCDVKLLSAPPPLSGQCDPESVDDSIQKTKGGSWG